MRYPWLFRVAGPLLVTAILFVASGFPTGAQSQEPKPTSAATPLPQATPVAQTSLVGNTWEIPEFGVTLSWDAAVWTVESEQLDVGYAGLSLSTANSTVYIEAFEDPAGDTEACLESATNDISSRAGVSEVTPLADRPMPNASKAPHQLFGFVLTTADNEPFRGLEYVECRALPDEGGMAQLTWQAPVGSYNAELPAVSALFSALSVPGQPPLIPAPELPEMPPDLAPNSAAARGWLS